MNLKTCEWNHSCFVLLLATLSLALLTDPATASTTTSVLEGQVIDALTRAPLPEATVTVLDLEDIDEATARIALDENAHFSLTLPNGRWTLKFEAPHHVPAVHVVRASPDNRDIRVALEPMLTETVIVRAMPTLRADSSRLEGTDIQRESDSDVVETLRTLPGVAAVRRGAIGLDPVIRGLRETQLGAFVDGTRMFGAGPGRMDSALSHVDPLDLERIEVLKGPHALLHGAGAMSAVVATTEAEANSVTRRTGGTVLAGFDSQGSRSVLRASVEGSSARQGWTASLTHREGRDFEDGHGRSVDGFFESTSARVTTSWDLGPQDEFDVRLSYQKQNDVEYEGRLLDADFFETYSGVLDWSHRARSGSAPDLEMKVYAHRIDHEMSNDNKPSALPNPNRMPPFPMDVQVDTESDTNGLRFIASWSGTGGKRHVPWLIQSGLDAYSLERRADRQIARRDTGMIMFEDALWPDVEIDDIGLLTIVTLSPSEDLQWAAGARVDFVRADAVRTSDYFQEHSSGAVKQEDTNVSLTLSMDWQFAEGWGLRAGIGRVPRSPDALERYADRFPSTRFQIAAEFLGDPGLKPETASELDLGVHWDKPRVSLFADAFYRSIEDYITIEADPSLSPHLPTSPPAVYRYVNGRAATYYGMEAGVEVRPREHWTIKASADWLWSEDGSFNEAALGTAPLGGVFSVTRDWSRVQAEVRMRWADDQERVAATRFEQPTAGWAVYDLMVDVDLPRGGKLGLRVENIGDHAYVDHLAGTNPFTKERVPEPGVSFGATLSWVF